LADWLWHDRWSAAEPVTGWKPPRRAFGYFAGPEVLLPGLFLGLALGTGNGFWKITFGSVFLGYVLYQWLNIRITSGRFLRTRRYFVPLAFRRIDLSTVTSFEVVSSSSGKWSPRGCYGVQAIRRGGSAVQIYESTSYTKAPAERWLASLNQLLVLDDWTNSNLDPSM
jgi:hypothetical protein